MNILNWYNLLIKTLAKIFGYFSYYVIIELEKKQKEGLESEIYKKNNVCFNAYVDGYINNTK